MHDLDAVWRRVVLNVCIQLIYFCPLEFSQFSLIFMTHDLVKSLTQSQMHIYRKCLRNKKSHLLRSPCIFHQPIHVVIQLRNSSHLSIKALDRCSDLVHSLLIFRALCFHLLLHPVVLFVYELLERVHL